MRLVFLTEEALAVLNDLLDPLPKDVDVGLHEAVLLQQVLHAHQVLPEVVREQAQLQLLHRVQDVQHLLQLRKNVSEEWRNYEDNWGQMSSIT
jgi:hypothetical protein